MVYIARQRNCIGRAAMVRYCIRQTATTSHHALKRKGYPMQLLTRAPSRLARLEPRRICIIKPSSLGDIVHALPIVSALRKRWPSAHLAWVVNDTFQDLLKDHPHLDELIIYQRHGAGIDRIGIGSTIDLYRRLHRGEFDLTLDLQGLLRSALMTVATGAKVRIGISDAREGARWFYTERIDAPRRVLHAVERIERVVQALGGQTTDVEFNIPLSLDDRRWADTALAGAPVPRVILNVGARWRTKRWPPAHFAAIGRRAALEFGAGLIAVGGQNDRPLVDALLHELRPIPVVDLCGRTRILQYAALAAAADLLVSNDTGPLHLAAALGTRVLGVYTCTSPRLTGPVGPRAATVQSCVWCAPSFLRQCHRLECMTELTPERVWPAVKAQLEQAMGSSSGGRRM
jgi:heptosyltransferase I